MNDCTTKTCTKCKQPFPATSEYFYCNGKYLRSRCKRCESAMSHGYYIANREEIRVRHHQYHVQNRDRMNQRSREYYLQNREIVLEKCRKYAAANKDKVRMRNRLYQRRNPERSRMHYHNYQSRKRGAEGTYTADDIHKQYASQNGRCWWCGKKVGKKYHVDHVIPLSRGGTNRPENLVISCPHCNVSKNDKLPQEWAGRLF